MEIIEIFTDRLTRYKSFMREGFINDEEHFGITAADDEHAGFPTDGLADSFTLAAMEGDEWAGVVSFAREGKNREKLRHKGDLFRMYVHPAYRGKGVSRLLIEALLARAGQLPEMEHITLFVIAENTVARKLYTRFGFETYGVERNAFKWKEKYFSKELMVLDLKS